MRASAFPPWQSVQPRRTVPDACMVGWSVCVWQEMHPALLRAASAGVWPATLALATSPAAGNELAGIFAAASASDKLAASAAMGTARERCLDLTVRFVQFGVISVS